MPLTAMAQVRALRATRNTLLACLLGLGMGLILSAPAMAKVVGETVFARGAATLQKPDGRLEVMGKDTPIEEGDVLSTRKGSFAIVRFRDGTSMTLRPDTVFKVESFEHDEGTENAFMRLFRGGLRAITGLVSKRNPDGVKIRTAVATIGIRGTDFSARLCDKECVQEARAHARFSGNQRSGVVGRVAFVKGRLYAVGGANERRRLVTGGPIHEGDILETENNSIAVLAFQDEGRITLQADSRFQIEQYRYDAKQPERSNALMRLVRGGLRAVTGLVGRNRPESYQMRTPVATIGIRGTGFDLVCQGACVEGGTATLDPLRNLNRGLSFLRRAVLRDAFAQGTPGANGMFILPWQGTLLVDHSGGPIRLETGQNLFLSNRTTAPIRNPVIPTRVLQRLAQAIRPDRAEVPPKLFETTPQNEARPGLYVSVYDDGHATVSTSDDQVLNIGRNEAGFVGTGPGEEPARIEGGLPRPLLQDPYNKPPTTPVTGPGLSRDAPPGGSACGITE